MGQILQNWRILGAAFLSIALILGAYLLAQSVRSPRSAEASPESALLQAIATKDTDGDGLTDWEEALYGTSPNITDTFNLGMTDGEAVAKGLIVPKAISDISLTTSTQNTANPLDPSLPPPAADGTLTSAFTKNFFELYLDAKQAKGGADLSESEMADITNEALDSLSSAITTAPDFKSAKDLNVSGTGAESLKEFAINAEAVLLKNTSNASKSEIFYLQDAVENNDTDALSHIASIAKGYRDSAAGLAVLSVPVELAESHLALVNALMRMSEILSDFTRVNEDTLATVLALQQYPRATFSISTAFINIGNIYKSAGISLPSGAPGASFVNLIEDIIADQQAAKKP